MEPSDVYWFGYGEYISLGGLGEKSLVRGKPEPCTDPLQGKSACHREYIIVECLVDGI